MTPAKAAGRAALAWPSLILAGLCTAFTLRTLGQMAGTPNTNGWDVVVPQVGNLQLIPLLIAVLWTPAVIARHHLLSREDVLLRHGSWSTAVKRVVISDGAVLAGVLLLSIAAVLAVSTGLGLDAGWSGHALTVLADGGIDTDISATAAAAVTGSPWIFLALQTMWLWMGLVSLALLHVAAIVGLGRRAADVLLITVGVWGVLSGAGIFGVRPFPDMSAWTNGLWAVGRPASMGITLMVWVVAAALAYGTAAARDDSSGGRGLGRVPVVLSLFASIGIVLLYAWLQVDAGALEGGSGLLEIAFAGQYSSLVGYVVACLPGVVAAGLISMHMAELEGGRLTQILLRRGSPGRWALVVLTRAVGAAAATSVLLVGILVLAGTRLTPQAEARTPEEWVLLALSYTVFCLVLAVPALLLFWVRGTVHAWPFVVITLLFMGYPTVFPPISANPLAPFSLQPGTPLHFAPVVASTALLGLLLAGLAVVLTRHRVPPNS